MDSFLSMILHVCVFCEEQGRIQEQNGTQHRKAIFCEAGRQKASRSKSLSYRQKKAGWMDCCLDRCMAGTKMDEND